MTNFKAFWERRSKRKGFSRNIGNLEDDSRLYKLKITHETTEIDKIFENISNREKLLDLGGGEGFWSIRFANLCKEVTIVDFSSDMLAIAKKNGEKENHKNIRYVLEKAEKYSSKNIYNIVFISGLMIYLEDKSFKQLINRIESYTSTGSMVLLRDGTAKDERYEIKDKYSEALEDHYSAIYRTKSEYVDAFSKVGFKLIIDQQMFPEGHELNKFPETRLWLYLFCKESA